MPDALTTLRRLEESVYRFDFFHAVRLLECTYPERPRVGESLRPRDDFVRFAQEPELIFHPTALGKFEMGKEGAAPRLLVNFIGLLGANGPLPTHLTEYVRDRLRNAGDPAFARFLDVFHHRMVSLFYRACAQSQPTVSLDRPGHDRFSAYVGMVFGLAEPTLRQRDAVPDFAKLHFAGLLGGPTRPAAGLRLVLSRFFGLQVEIEECVGHWITLPPDAVSRLGARDGSCALGMSTLLGGRVWDRQHKFRVVIGPLGMTDYQRFLPGGDSLKRLTDWVRNYVRDGLDWDVNICLKQKEVPRLQLGRHVRIGYTSWLHSGPAPHDAHDLLLNPTGSSGRARA